MHLPSRATVFRYLRLTAYVLFGLAAVSAVAVLLVIRHFETGLPDVHDLRAHYQPPQVTRVLARDGTVLASLFVERRTVIPFAEIPSHAKLAFLAAEDAQFYEHQGLNYFGMLRALLANVKAGHTRQGASTITQQVVKNVLLDSERTYQRKIKETILARRLEKELSKDEIFSLYLNYIYLGHGRYGIEEAARYYFGKKAKDLDVAESALLAGLVASPERYSPRHDEARALARRRYVLDQMLEKSFITPELHDLAQASKVRLAPASDGESELAPEVVSYVKKVLDDAAGESAVHGGYTIETTIDPALQAAARRAVRDNLDNYATRQKLVPPFTQAAHRLWGPLATGIPRQNKIYVGKVTATDDAQGTLDVQVGDVLGRVTLASEERYNPKHLPPSGFAKVGAALRVGLVGSPDGVPPVPLRLELGPESALVAIDVRSREVRALIGSYEAITGGLDRATRAHRQPGSSFKPILYSYALHSRRFTPASVLDLTKKNGKELVSYRESVRTAIAESDNAAADKLIDEVGAANVVEWAHALGITTELQPTPSLALGAYEVIPIELCNAYVTFANGGEFELPKLVTRIVGPDGKVLALSASPPTRRVLSPDEAYLITSLMRGVVEHGTAQRARSLGRPLAGKTGTTNLAKDTWFVGYSTELAAAVWVGYDDALPLGWGEAGAATALPAWISFMKVAHDKKPPTEFPKPSSIVTVNVDPATGLLPYPGQDNAIEEEFLDGTAPTEVAKPDAGVEAGAADAGPDDETRAAKAQPDAGSAADAGAAPGNESATPPVSPPPF
ncbi:MAG TPA: PBP1A family penicillin-binding protein [Polyangiaceae bacterium]|jgi:penicillin-binding protein 1A|nr:PBP1A family penicillin-binding protein [Polyangiaceae bacterium]